MSQFRAMAARIAGIKVDGWNSCSIVRTNEQNGHTLYQKLLSKGKEKLTGWLPGSAISKSAMFEFGTSSRAAEAPAHDVRFNGDNTTARQQLLT